MKPAWMSYTSLLLLAAAIPALLYGEEKKIAFEGKLVSATCYLPKKSPATTGNDMGKRKGCGTFCLQHGSPGGLLTKDNAFYILDVSSVRLAPYVGQEIRVTGNEYSKDVFLPDKVEIKKDGGWQEVDLRFHPEK